MADSAYCDGCGFCCLPDVGMLRLEFQRIQTRLQQAPDLLRHQGLICPFLDFDRQRFDRNLARYGQEVTRLEPSPCRIYEERPIVCRLWPGPDHRHCRQHAVLEAPDIKAALSEPTREAFPELLIQQYYLTLEWDNRNVPELVLDPELSFCLVPGWRLDREGQRLVSSEGPNWINGMFDVTRAFPVPDVCELEPWAVEVMASFEQPGPYLPVVQRFADQVGVEELATLLTQAELANVLSSVDAPLRANAGFYSVWDWMRLEQQG